MAKTKDSFVTAYVDIPEPIQNVYKMYRPSPLIRAYELEKALDTGNQKYIRIRRSKDCIYRV